MDGVSSQLNSQLKILIADDSAVYRKLVEQSLSVEHYFLFFAKNGKQAIELFAEHQPEVLITDWTMPDITGIELCQRVRSEFPNVYSHIILLTSHSDKERLIEGLASGADDYLTKPFHPGELQARVRVGHRIASLHHQLLEKNRQLEELALTDPLTGLPNRRAIDVWATRQLNAAARHDFSIWVAIADIDHFKAVNDRYGHDVGDLVLESFAEILKKNTRQSNICGRLGGEEFIALITHVKEKKDVEIAIDRIRKQFEAQKFNFAGQNFNCTVSFGVAEFCGKTSGSFQELVKKADIALYSAKHKGRNRIEFA